MKKIVHFIFINPTAETYDFEQDFNKPLNFNMFGICIFLDPTASKIKTKKLLT